MNYLQAFTKIGECKDYCFHSNWDGDGEIYNSDGEVVWRFKSTGLKHGSAESKLHGTLVFAVYDNSQREWVTICRERRFPLGKFVVVENGLPICTIRQRDILFINYTLEFDRSQRWRIHMPIFTVFYHGTSDLGEIALIRFRTRQEWYVRITAGSDNLSIISSLAFIIRKKVQKT